MQTEWGDIRVSDAHVHFFSHGFFSALAAQRKSTLDDLRPLLGWELPPADPNELADRWVVELDHSAVSRAVLIASLPGDEASVTAAVARHPDRFCGFFMCNPTLASPETYVASALSTGLMQGICLFPAMHRFSVQDPRLMPIYEIAAARPGTVVFVHCGVLSVGVRKKLGLPSHFDMRFSSPIDLHAIALQFPKLNFIVPHFGAGYFREALMLCDLCPNVYLDTSSSNNWMRYEGLDLKTVFQRAREVCGAGRLLFGTDSSFFPRGWNAAIYQAQSAALAGLGVSAEEAGRIFGSNLERLMCREL
jgi:predicted TIM-barrel fold metal-dependent hydrolase